MKIARPFLFLFCILNNLNFASESTLTQKVLIDYNSYGMTQDNKQNIYIYFIDQLTRLSTYNIISKESLENTSTLNPKSKNIGSYDTFKLQKYAKSINFDYLLNITLNRSSKRYIIMTRFYSIKNNTSAIYNSEAKDETELFTLLTNIAFKIAEETNSRSKTETLQYCPLPSDSIRHVNLKITSEPKGLDIYLDHINFGKTPLLIENLIIGSHTLELKHPYCNDSTSTIILNKEDCNSLHYELRLKKSGKIKINPDLQEVTIYLDSKHIGTAPNTFYNIPYGKHTISLMSNYLTHNIAIEINSDSLRILNPILNKNIPFTVNGKIHGADIYINNQFVNKFPLLNYEVKPGIYDLKVKKYGYETYRNSIITDSYIPISQEVHLLPKSTSKAIGYSILFPGLGHLYSNRKYGLIYTITSICNLYLLIDSNSKFNHLISDYNSLKNKYYITQDSDVLYKTHLQLDKKHKELKKAEKQRNTFIATTVGIWLINLIDTRIFWPYDNIELEISGASSQNDNPGLSISFHLDK